MATSSSPQELASSFLRKGQKTAEDPILYSLENLKGSDFKKFRRKLSDFSYEKKLPIPRAKLKNADFITTKNLLIDTYGEEGALDVMYEVFKLMGLMGPADDLHERREQRDIEKNYRVSVKATFQRIIELYSHMVESANQQERCTSLLMRKRPQIEEAKKQKIWSSGSRPLQIMEKRSSHKYSPTTIQALFDPDEDGFIPKIVVLEGPAGIGKTMTSKKIMLDWASGDLYQNEFDFVFYLSCREINTIIGDISLVGLLSRTSRRWSSGDLISILEDPGSRRKLLFILDGFNELRWTLEEKSEGCPDIFLETHKEIILQSLLRRQVLPESSLIITTRSLAMEKLNTFTNDYRNVEIQGFTGKDQVKYVQMFCGNKEDADKILSIIKANEVLYTMCAVPVTCWILCTAIMQNKIKDLALKWCDTMTSFYLFYLEVLINHYKEKGFRVNCKPSLKKLCALANEGVLNRQILFEKKDLERHGLSLSEVESVFLIENIFHWDFNNQTCYSFIHQNVQDFFAALYYGLDDGSGKEEGTPGVRGDIFPLKICNGISFTASTSLQDPHLALAVQFLFGLLNEKEVKTFSKITGINISLRVKSAIKEWTMKDFNDRFPIHAIVCLYETQDKDFIGSILSRCSHLRVDGSCYLWKDSNYSKQLSYCLKTLKKKRFQDLRFEWLTVDAECQKNLSPLLHRCQTVSLIGCNLTTSCCADLYSVLTTNQSLTTLDLSINNLRYSGIKLLYEGLKDPRCTLQELSFNDNDLTDSSCTHLASVIRDNQTLRKLDLSKNHLEGPHFRDLMTALTTSRIEELHLNDNNLTDRSCTDLASGIRDNQKLRRLDLSENNLEGPHFSDLMEALTTSQIEALLLTHNKLTDSSCTHLALGIRNNQNLRRLDLSDNNLKGPHLGDLMTALATSQIEELLLQDVGLTYEYAPFLVSLSNCTSLTVLDLKYNHLTDASAEYIEDLMLTSSRLKEIRIDENDFSIDEEEKLKKLMDEIRDYEKSDYGDKGALNKSDASAESGEESDNLVTPIVDGRTYRLKLKPGGLFCCSETGIMFKVKSEVTIKYELGFEGDYEEQVQENGYDIVGPVFNITVEPGVVSEVHLPHSLCLEGLKRGIVLIRFGNFKDGKMKIIKPITIGPSYIVLENPSFSGLLPLLSKLWRRPVSFKGKVLLYSKVVCPQNKEYLEYRFHLYVIPRNQPEITKLHKQKQNKGFQDMEKPHDMTSRLYTKTDYTVRAHPDGKISRELVQFEISCETESLSFTEVNVDRNAKELSLSISLMGSDDLLWKGDITEGASMQTCFVNYAPCIRNKQ